MSRNFVDMSNERYGRLVCKEPSERECKSSKYWICLCDCGNTTEVLRNNLLKGHVKSCGCLWNESRKQNGKNRLKHGHSVIKSITYTTWEAMRQRCNNPNSDWYHRYGGRGISICERWNKFENFIEDMGERPKGKTLDRINPNGNYEPTNCKWATPIEQSNNKADKYES